jgi:uncharacterized protein YcgI (DUF1989 family)
MFPACDRRRYELDFGAYDHPNCVASIEGALRAVGIEPPPFEPINLFMNFVYHADGTFTLHAPTSRAGDCVVFVALTPMVVALAACPQEKTPCNGWNPTDLLLERFASEAVQS